MNAKLQSATSSACRNCCYSYQAAEVSSDVAARHRHGVDIAIPGLRKDRRHGETMPLVLLGLLQLGFGFESGSRLELALQSASESS